MNTCAVHSSGALLLEDERKLREDSFRNVTTSIGINSESSIDPRRPSMGPASLLELGGLDRGGR